MAGTRYLATVLILACVALAHAGRPFSTVSSDNDDATTTIPGMEVFPAVYRLTDADLNAATAAAVNNQPSEETTVSSDDDEPSSDDNVVGVETYPAVSEMNDEALVAAADVALSRKTEESTVDDSSDDEVEEAEVTAIPGAEVYPEVLSLNDAELAVAAENALSRRVEAFAEGAFSMVESLRALFRRGVVSSFVVVSCKPSPPFSRWS
eukprot:TRINITY_DN2292_c0_g1_i3.p1 TRINITY_DN2292_c0_g1~~TRINITY_DN2292_c0_g1_i3.p1  ORF type:complete len:208 (+),score=14.25 TRINITY_DN2292_c0_g1_i3:173-796(+)